MCIIIALWLKKDNCFSSGIREQWFFRSYFLTMFLEIIASKGN